MSPFLARVDVARHRRSFASLENVLELPNLIDIQRSSFEWLTDPEKGGLRETINDISPIEDYTGNLAVVFGELWFDDPPASIAECREKDMIYSRPLNVKVAFQNRDTGEIREQTVFMGDFPWMTDWGTFIINGTERVVVTQLVRSPGAYVMEPKDREKQVFIANLMPARGSWLELEIDKKGRVYVRIDRKRKLPVSVLLRAMGDTLREGGYVPETWTGSDEEILDLFDNSLYIRLTLEADTEVTKSEEGSLIELFKKQRSEEHTSELQSRLHLVCRPLLEKTSRRAGTCALLDQGRDRGAPGGGGAAAGAAPGGGAPPGGRARAVLGVTSALPPPDESAPDR